LREEAGKLAMTEGVGISEAARRLSILMKTLENWVRAAKTGKLDNVGQHQKPLTEIEAELGRLKRELAEVKVERDLLKKFATYFAVERIKDVNLATIKLSTRRFTARRSRGRLCWTAVCRTRNTRFGQERPVDVNV
jgi:transposase